MAAHDTVIPVLPVTIFCLNYQDSFRIFVKNKNDKKKSPKIDS
jgi:hypothetical protein